MKLKYYYRSDTGDKMQMSPFIKRNLSDSAKAAIRESIHKMPIKKEMKLPPETKMAELLGVSRITVRKALDELEQEGIVIRCRGRGTFVNTEAIRIKVGLNTAYEHSKLIEMSGYQSRVDTVGVQECEPDSKLREAFNISDSGKVIVVTRMFYADEHLAIMCVDRFSDEAFYETPDFNDIQKWNTTELFRLKAGIILKRTKVELESFTVNELKKGVPGIEKFECKSVLRVSGYAYCEKNEPYLYGESYYDTDYVKFNMIQNFEI